MTLQKKRARERAYKRQRGQCYYCQRTVAKHKATLDHKIPACRGGTLGDGNAVMACADCNTEKGAMPASVFVQGEEARRRWKEERSEWWRFSNFLGSRQVAEDYGALISTAAERAREILSDRDAMQARRREAAEPRRGGSPGRSDSGGIAHDGRKG